MSTATETVLITGATAGIGRATALHLVRQGHHVIATGRKADLLETLRAEAQGKQLPGRLDVALLDVTSQASIDRAKAEVDRLTGGRGVDVLINNAGYGLAGPLADITDADLRAQFETNVFGLMAVTRAFVPAMRARKRGTIVNVSSIGGKVTFPFFGAYHGTKYAVEAFSDSLRYELQPFGIKVVVIEPGPIRTNFGDTSVKTAQSYTGTAYAGAIAKATAIQARFEKNAAPPESVAKVIGRVIGKRRPAARYAAPFYNGAIFWLAAVLPQRSWDWVVRRMTFISSKYVTVDETPASQPVSKKPAGHAVTSHAPN